MGGMAGGLRRPIFLATAGGGACSGLALARPAAAETASHVDPNYGSANWQAQPTRSYDNRARVGANVYAAFEGRVQRESGDVMASNWSYIYRIILV